MDLPQLPAGKRFTLPRPPLSADALLLAQLATRETKAGLATAIFTADANDAQRLIDELAFFAPDLRCALFPDWETLPYDSWWAIAAIRAHPALDHIPALLVTADAGEHHNVEAETAGFDGIVSRPFARDDLVRTVALLAATGRQPHRRPRAQAVVSVFDSGFVLGDGV